MFHTYVIILFVLLFGLFSRKTIFLFFFNFSNLKKLPRLFDKNTQKTRWHLAMPPPFYTHHPETIKWQIMKSILNYFWVFKMCILQVVWIRWHKITFFINVSNQKLLGYYQLRQRIMQLIDSVLFYVKIVKYFMIRLLCHM